MAVKEFVEKAEIERLRKVFDDLDTKKDGKLDAEEIKQRLEDLGYKSQKVTDYGNSEAEDMIWEVDDDCDGKLSWEDVESLFVRCRQDKTGFEPKRLFNLLEFMLHDKDSSGKVDMDECMEILFHRFGKEALEQLTDEFFAADDGDKELDFNEFMQTIRKSQKSQRQKASNFSSTTSFASSASTAGAKKGSKK
mmetsp:Transcript_42016/g.108150  ORF Transcript_42016/g.108150 Transcript_42016/m.108150 type:complete len:193 (-) Transcript_42016:303-881(-)|eukprot:CAMPEP_0113897584 /NCGR_PEP_ID=MMETSP0780_2-20120614/18789_1 /TAXON_ID=652834 /ORGANISM="Palpitomonas bilix" /LENGTH=192 /DNA_ID=CAMNT_0000889121 /DNA_START=134 /DNA_END=712 /DNA_ORIENTATION=+ /assembly_acc=CAM_ASM_000599